MSLSENLKKEDPQKRTIISGVFLLYGDILGLLYLMLDKIISSAFVSNN